MGQLIGVSIDLHQRVLLTICHFSRGRSSVRTAYDRHELFNFPALFGFVARADRMFDTVRHVISENFLLNASQCRSDGSDLRDNVNAVAVFLDHSGQATYLTFDPVEAFRACSLDVRSHEGYIPP
jgi:hypothetical protein